MNLNNEILFAKKVQKTYQGKDILREINLQLFKGEAVFLVGSNGCGKSTLIRILAGLTKADKGIITYENNLTMALIPDRFEKNNMTVEKFLHHMLALDELACDWGECLTYVKEYQLEGMLQTPMKYLSKGTLQKVAVIQVLISDRKLIFMDEPLSGQDMLSQMKFVKELKNRKQNGTSFLAACHEKYLIEELADRIYEVRDGKLVDGCEYVYGNRIKKGLFFLQGIEEEWIKNAWLAINPGASIIASNYGSMLRVELELIETNKMFQYCIQNDIHIVRYEEVETLC